MYYPRRNTCPYDFFCPHQAVGPNLMLPTMLTLWGIVAMAQGLVRTYSGLLACRFFLGLLEGGLFPGIVLYLSYFYPRYKMALR